MQIGKNSKVTLNFALSLAGGDEIDNNFDAPPVSFAIGDGSLLPGFEAVLFGLRAGDRREFLIPAAQAFGTTNTDNLRFMPRERFADTSAELQPGLVVSFDSPDGQLAGVIRSLQGDLVVVDFNHPLAGRDIVFKVTIAAVEPAG